MIETMDWIIDVLVPAFFMKLDSWLLVGTTNTGLTVLSLTAAMFLIWFCVRRFT